MSAALAKLAAALLSSEKGRKAVGWALVAIFSPAILLIAFLCSVGSGTASHNNAAIDAIFFGTHFSDNVPQEYRDYISDVRAKFEELDVSMDSVNEMMEDGSLDSVRVKAIYLTLCTGDEEPPESHDGFLSCFYDTEERTRDVPVEENGEPKVDENGDPVTQQETYTAAVQRSMDEVYEALEELLGREITETEKRNIEEIYIRVAGQDDAGEPGSGGSAERGPGVGTVIDISGFTDPSTKNAHDLAAYAKQAWENGWGYVWGTCGKVLTDSAFRSKLDQYPEQVGGYEDFIRQNWLNRRTTDCNGLIKGYGWLDTETLEIQYGTNGMPDCTANEMFNRATVTGPIDTIPEIPGIAVWHRGHIGVYIGGGKVIEAMGTKWGVVMTDLSSGSWTNWLEIPYISYEE